MVAKGSRIDFMFLAPLPPTRKLDPLLQYCIIIDHTHSSSTVYYADTNQRTDVINYFWNPPPPQPLFDMGSACLHVHVFSNQKSLSFGRD